MCVCVLQRPVHGMAPQPPASFTHVMDKFSGGQLIRKQDKNRGSSRFNISKNRDIQKLPLLKGVQ